MANHNPCRMLLQLAVHLYTCTLVYRKLQKHVARMVIGHVLAEAICSTHAAQIALDLVRNGELLAWQWRLFTPELAGSSYAAQGYF